MDDRTVIQWDKDDLALMGLLKVDVLALGMLTALHKALDFIGARKGHVFEMQDIPAEDPATYDMICKADIRLWSRLFAGDTDPSVKSRLTWISTVRLAMCSLNSARRGPGTDLSLFDRRFNIG